MTKIKWEDPPEETRKLIAAFDLLTEVATRPGQWARISTHRTKKAAQTAMSGLKAGGRKKPPGDWEFQVGPVDESGSQTKYGLWARLIPIEEGGGEGGEPEADVGRVHIPE